MDLWYAFHQEHFGDENVQWFKWWYLSGNMSHENDAVEVISTPQIPPPTQHSTFPAPDIELSEEMHHFLYQNALRRAQSKSSRVFA